MSPGPRTLSWGRTHPPTLKGLADDETLERTFKALANETRRAILAMLHDFGGYMESHEIAERFDIPWQSISRHLRVLTEAGLISCDSRGKLRCYTLEPERLHLDAGRWIHRVATKGIRRRDGTLEFTFND